MRSKAERDGFTIVELLVAIVIIGILAGLLLPAIQQSRETARRMQCQSHLRQLGMAVVLFHEAFQFFPPGRLATRPGDGPEVSCGGEEATWPVHVLPFVEQTALRNEWEPYEKWHTQGDGGA